MKQIAKVLGIDGKGNLILVQSVEDKNEFQRGGTMHGYRYEWGVNHYAFIESKENTKEAYGLTDAEYDYWDAQYIHRYDPIADEWIVDQAIKTFNKIAE